MRNNTKNEEKKDNLARRLLINMLIAIILAICLCITSVALVLSTVTVSNNIFSTATFEIGLYNADDVLGGPIITKDDGFLFEPGMTVKKKFSLHNSGTVDAYFRIYFDDIDGALADILQVRITDADDNEIYPWRTMSEMVKKNTKAADKTLESLEKLELYIWFHMPEEATNLDKASLSLTFDMCADAVQKKNNDNKEFPTETTGTESSGSVETTETGAETGSGI